jgi:hypothetical protein
MKRTKIVKFFTVLSIGIGLLNSCTDTWLEPQPLSFLSTENAYRSIVGLESGLNACRKAIVKDFMLSGAYILLDYANTDLSIAVNGGYHNHITEVTPSTVKEDFWDDCYTQIKEANSILTGATSMELNDDVKKIIGEAYFIKAYWYYRLINTHGDVPLVNEEVTSPKLDFYTSTRGRIIRHMITNLEIAEEYLTDGVVAGKCSKAAVQTLLAKYYLQNSQFQKAVDVTTRVINNPVYALMTSRFGYEKSDAKKNVISDLFEKHNIALAENTEKLMVVLNTYGIVGNSGKSNRNREWATCWFNTLYDKDGVRATIDGISGEPQISDFGRGIGKTKKTNYYQYELWQDKNDLRHSYPATWVPIDSLYYNNPKSKYFGSKIIKTDNPSNDTLKGCDDMYVHKIFVYDEDIPYYQGATINGGMTDWYVFRLAETFLLRAEAYVWLRQYDKAKDDINVIRQRADAAEIATADLEAVLAERARELFLEEFRKTELVRIAYIFASNNMNGYSLSNMHEKNWFYDRVMDKNTYLKNRTVYLGVTYNIEPYHVYLPIPEASIAANAQGRINQNWGYIGTADNIEPIDED